MLRAAAFDSGGLMRDGLSLATWLRLDGFAWGGLLAVVARDVRVTRRRLGAIGAAALGVSSGLAALGAATGYLSQRTLIGASLQFACVDLFFAGLVAVSLGLMPSPQAPPRRSPLAVLASFGRISYCLYLIHLFVFWAFDRLAGVRPPIAIGTAALRALIVLAVCTVVAELSWRFLEAPSLERGLPVAKTAVAGPA
jgi:peptidoglycan/LPS O-acetylase OafA/YrhL